MTATTTPTPKKTRTRREVGTVIPRTADTPPTPHPSPEVRGNLQFTRVVPGTTPDLTRWSPVTYPGTTLLTLRGVQDFGGSFGDGVTLTTPSRKPVQSPTPRPTRTPRGDGPTLDGYSLCSVIRWCGSQGYTAGAVARGVETGWGHDPNRATVATQVQHGRKGRSVPVLPVDLQVKLRGLMGS